MNETRSPRTPRAPRSLLWMTPLGMSACLLCACGDDDPADLPDFGTVVDLGFDAGVEADAGAADVGATDVGASDVGTGDGGMDTLYDRLGGNAGITSAVSAIVADEVMDPEIAAFFATNTSTGAVPSVAQIQECLVNQLAAAAGGPETYPTTVSGGYTCRDMQTTHAGLGISGTVFDKFVMIAAATLTRLGVAADDVATIGTVLNGTKADVTEDTLYARLGAKRGIAMAVDAIVAQEVMDPEIAAFFAPNTQPGAVPDVTQISQCLVEQLGAAAGGRETYPTTLEDGYQCRDMVATHAGLGISSAVFDKFVMIAANTLTSAGVSAADVATIGTVLNGTKADIVEVQ